MKINYYIVINIAATSFLTGRCDGTKSSKSNSSQEDSDPKNEFSLDKSEIEISLSDEIKATRRPRTKKVTPTKDARFEVVPKVMVFDLDYVIWPYNVAVDVKPPFALNSMLQNDVMTLACVDDVHLYRGKRELVDHTGKVLKLYDGVGLLLGQLKLSGTKIAVVSQTPEVATVHHLLRLFDIERFLDYVEVSMESNTVHIQSLQKKVGCLYSEMVFFSHSEDAVDKVTGFEVISILVGDKGLTQKDVDHCLKNFKKLTTPK